MEAFQKIISFIDLCPFEINGFGIVSRNDNSFTIDDVFIIQQTVNPGHARTDDDALNLYVYELVRREGDPSKIRFQWHSHARLPAFFSPEDVETIQGYTNDFMISFVANKYGHYCCRVDITQPIGLSISVPVFLKVPVQNRESILTACAEDIVKLVAGLPKDTKNSFDHSTSPLKDFFLVDIKHFLERR